MILVLEKKRKESAKEYIMRILLDNIVNVRLKPGDQLLERDFCKLCGVSRTPFREALLELAQRHLVEIRSKIGTYVSYIDLDLVDEVRHMRSVLESELARMACRMIGKDDLKKLRENVARWKVCVETDQVEESLVLDKEFHGMIYQLCGRGYWHELAEGLAPHFDRTSTLKYLCRLATENVIQDHEELLDAIEDRDEEKASEIARRHLNRYTENIEEIREHFPDYFVKPKMLQKEGLT